MGELLIAVGLSASSSEEQSQYHGSQEFTTDTGGNFRPGLHISNSNQEAAIINQQHNPENGTRQIDSVSLDSLPFDLETREVRTETEISPANGNLQGQDSLLGGAIIPNGCAQHSNIESSRKF
jgi:hypothetical protein